jgi:hypothetical protein
VRRTKKTTTAAGAANNIGTNNQATHVVVNVALAGGVSHDALNDAERELVRSYRATDQLGRLAITHVALLAEKTSTKS